MNLGVLGGTFDPIHLGHLLVAEEARSRLKMARVLFMPAGVPWLRAEQLISPSHHRLAMVRLAVANNPNLEASALEIERPGDTYTVDTLEELRRRLGQETAIYFILGRDSVSQLPRWREPKRLLELCHLVIVDRPGHLDVDLSALDETTPGASQRLTRLGGPLVGISGTEIRKRVAQGLTIRYWVPEAVEEYIYRHGLYRGGEGQGEGAASEKEGEP